MSWDRRLDLHIDVDAPSSRNLLVSETDASILNSPPEFVSGDKLKVRLHFWRRGTTPGTLTSIDPGATATFRFSGRPQGVPVGSSLLFVAEAFTQVGTGIWETTVDLATTELAAHLAESPAGQKTITAEVEIRDSGDTTRRSFQFAAKALPEVYQPDDASPTPLPAVIGETAPSNVMVVTGAGSAFANGSYVQFGTLNGKPAYSKSGTNDLPKIYWRPVPSPAAWIIEGMGMYISTENTATPDLVTVWSDLTAAPPAPAVGLAAGTPAPPYIRVAGGFLYIQDAGVWKKTALSAL